METPDPASGSALRRAGRAVARAWFSADPRALGLFRIAFGLLCMWDVVRRLPFVEVFYSNAGVLANHFSLYRPHGEFTFSLLLALSHPGEVAVFFGFALVCLTLFTLGAWTRVTHLLSMLCIISLHSRNVLLENGGDVVMNLWWLWTLFLPLGRRFSLDALFRSLRERKEGPDALNDAPPPDRARVWSLAVFAVLCQYGVIYFFNTVHKGGPTWMDGTCIAWVLQQDRIVTPFGLWVRESWPLWMTQAMTWGTLVIEGAAPFLFFSPIATKWCRRVAIISLIGLHGGIFLMTDVGLFSPTMIVGYLLLIDAADIELLRRALRRLAGPPVQAWYDSDCGVCHLSARTGARLDRLGLITWLPRFADAPLPPGYSQERFEAESEVTIIVTDGQRVWTHHRAIARLLAAVPLGRLVAWIAWVPGISALSLRGYRAFSARRHLVSAALGMGVCGLNKPKGEVGEVHIESAAGRLVRRTGFVLANAVLLACMAATTSQMLIENRFVRRHLHIEHHQPTWARAIVQYGRWFQGWSMFAPDAPKRDGWLVIDAELPDGTHIDPQTGEAPRFEALRAEWMYHGGFRGQFWGTYGSRLAGKRNSAYRPGLISWLRNTRLQRLHLPPGQQLRAITVWWIGDKSPDPRVGGEPVVDEKYIVVRWPKRAGDDDGQ